LAFRHRFLLGMSSVDRAGVLFYPELFRHAHDACEAFLAHIGEPLHQVLAAGEMALPVVHAEADYLAPLRHGVEVEAAVTVGDIGDTSFRLDCTFYTPVGDLAARARSVHVCIDAGSGRPLSLPAALRKRLQAD